MCNCTAQQDTNALHFATSSRALSTLNALNDTTNYGHIEQRKQSPRTSVQKLRGVTAKTRHLHRIPHINERETIERIRQGTPHTAILYAAWHNRLFVHTQPEPTGTLARSQRPNIAAGTCMYSREKHKQATTELIDIRAGQ